MPQQLHGKFFGATEKALARALYDADQSDTEIALAIGTSVNNIIWWRREEGLSEHGASTPAPTVIELPVPRSATTSPDPRLMTPTQALVAHAQPSQPEPANALAIGTYLDATVSVDLNELLTTRLLIQGNSGSGKSHLLRRLLEESAERVQQIIIDPEGDFASFGEAYGHTVVNAAEHGVAKMRLFASRAREHCASVVLNLDGFEVEDQMDAVAAFLGGLFDAPREQWRSAIIAVDEAHLFAPSNDNGEDKDTRRACLAAMTNLMCRGRKRGLAGIIATQRLAKLHKNVAGEASNFLMGRTMLDIDIKRAADLLGLPAREAEQIRDLSRGEFLGLGPAVARRPMKIKVGPVKTAARGGAPGDPMERPRLSPAELAALMMAPDEEEVPAVPALRVVR